MQDYTTLGNPIFLFQAALHQPFPEWVANQPMPKSEDFEKSASAAFADPDRRLLPLTDPVATFHSAIDLFANIDKYPAAAFDRVKAACALFNIEHDVAPYAALFASKMEKAAAEAPDTIRYAIDEELGGTRYRLLPLESAADVIEASVELRKMAAENRIHYIHLWKAARQVVDAAGSLGVENLHPTILRLGAERQVDFRKAASMIEKRASLAKVDDVDLAAATADYDAVIKQAEAGEISMDECVIKIAAIDDVLGVPLRLVDHYPVALPHEVVFSGPLVAEAEKAAAANALISDVLIPLSALKEIPDVEIEFKLSKAASKNFRDVLASNDARDVSLAVANWEDRDRRTLLRLAASVG